MKPNSDWLRFGSGMVHVKKGDIQKAEEIFNDIHAGNPSFGHAPARLGFIRHDEGNIEAAKLFFNRALDNLPDDEMGHYYRGLIHMKTGEYDEAENSFSIVITLNPLRFDAIINYAGVIGRKGDFRKAENIVAEAYRKDETHRNGFAWLGWIKTEEHDWAGALAIMNRDYQESRVDPWWVVNIALMFGRVGDWDKAVKLMKDAYASANNLKDGFARLGWIKAESQDWTSAIDIMKRDINEDRITPNWRINYSIMLVFAGDNTGAERLVHDLYSINKNAKNGYAKIGWAHYLLYRDKQSLNSLIRKDAVLNRMSDVGKRLNAIALCIDGKLDEAVTLANALYSESPLEKDVFAIMGWELIKNGDLEIGMEFMEKDYIANRLSTVWRTNYAYRLAKYGQCKKAKKIFQEVMKNEPYRQELRIGYQIIPSVVMSLQEFKEMVGLEILKYEN